MTSFIAAGGSGRSISVIPAVPAAWSVTTIAFMGIVSSAICLFGGNVAAIESHGSSAVLSRHFSARTSVSEWDRQFRLIRVHHEHREELRRFCFAGIGADDVAVAGQLGEALSGLVGRHRSIIDLTADRSLKHGRVDEG